MICQDPIYFANNGVSLERSGNSKVNLRRKDGSVLELARPVVRVERAGYPLFHHRLLQLHLETG